MEHGPALEKSDKPPCQRFQSPKAEHLPDENFPPFFVKLTGEQAGHILTELRNDRIIL